MDDKTARELVKELKGIHKALDELTKLLRRQSPDPAQPEDTERLEA